MHAYNIQIHQTYQFDAYMHAYSTQTYQIDAYMHAYNIAWSFSILRVDTSLYPSYKCIMSSTLLLSIAWSFSYIFNKY
jgi:hypothetical protein